MEEEILKARKVDRFPYLKEYEVYALWKFANPHLTRRSVFQFRDFVPANAYDLLVIHFMVDHFLMWGVSLPNLTFHNESYFKYGAGQEKIKEYLRKNKGSKNAQSLQNILDSRLTLEDLRRCPFVTQKGLMEFVEFDKNISKEGLKKVGSFLSSYIDEFIHDNLEKDEENYLIFENQLKRTLYILRGLQEKYGKEIVVRFNPETDLTFDGGYLFIHSIVAAEKLGYIKVISAWEEDDVMPEKQTEDYKIKLTLLKSEMAKAETGSKQLSPELTAVGKKGYFKFKKNGHPIEIGWITSLPYKLLKALIFPLGQHKSVESVFEDVYENKYKNAPELRSSVTAHSFRVQKLENTMKELQRIEEFQGGKLRLEFSPDNKRQVRLVVEL